MRPGRIGLSTLAALIVGALVVGASAAQAAPPAAAAGAAKPPEITKDQRDAGMKAAPALIQGAGVPCQLADARKIGDTPPDPKTKQVSSYYEVACKGAMGYVLVDHGKGEAPSWAACPDQAKVDAVSGKPNGAACFLPGNIDDKATLAPFVAKSGVPCDVANVRGIGHSAKSAYFEVACANGRGFVMTTTAPPDAAQPVQMISCLAFDATSPVACKLTNSDSQMAVIDQLAAKSGKNCTVTKKRYVLTSQDESNYYEVACQDGKGWMLQEKANGSFGEAISCADADGIGGGCTFTNGRQAQSEENALYSKLAHTAGYNCDVSKYSPFDVNIPGHEVVELACSNRPDGAVALFPASSSAGAKAVIYDCAHSEVAGYRCGFTQASAALPSLTADLRTLGKTSCVVSGERFIGRTADGAGFVEVACSDGAPGYIIEYKAPPLSQAAPTRATPCVQAQEIEGGCKMPENQKHG
jgi:hypothetical protein